MFVRARVVVFCDGDFWHGRDLDARVGRLARGHNAPYWIAKIEANVRRDRHTDRALTESGWTVLRFWERDILRRVDEIADGVATAVRRSPAGTR